MKLPEEVQNALREGTLSLSQGYIFAAHLDHPRLMEIFAKAVDPAIGFTNAKLEEEMKKGLKPAREGSKKRPFSQYLKSALSMKTGIAEQVEAFKRSDLLALLTGLKEIIALVEGRLPGAIDDGVPVAATQTVKKTAPVPQRTRAPEAMRQAHKNLRPSLQRHA